MQRQRFGFRQVEIKGRVLTINGRPVKLRGISRLDAHPLLGRALTPEVDRQDMELIKTVNFNLVRATIAPPHTAALDAADELGFTSRTKGPPAQDRRGFARHGPTQAARREDNVRQNARQND